MRKCCVLEILLWEGTCFVRFLKWPILCNWQNELTSSYDSLTYHSFAYQTILEKNTPMVKFSPGFLQTGRQSSLRPQLLCQLTEGLNKVVLPLESAPTQQNQQLSSLDFQQRKTCRKIILSFERLNLLRLWAEHLMLILGFKHLSCECSDTRLVRMANSHRTRNFIGALPVKVLEKL